MQRDQFNRSVGLHLPYYQRRELSVRVGDGEICVVTKPGLPAWDTLTPAAGLVAEMVEVSPDAQVLVIGCGHGASLVPIGRRIDRGALWLYDAHCAAVPLAMQTLRRNGVTALVHQCEPAIVPARLAGTFDVVVMEIPVGRALIRRALLYALRALRPGGVLYLAGAGDHGIRAAISDAEELFGSAAVAGYRKGSRIAVAVRGADLPSAPAWASIPGIALGTRHCVPVSVGGAELTLMTQASVFAFDQLDAGTALLLTHMPSVDGARVLDAGCGNGIIGITAARAGAAAVDLIDASLPAVEVARENCVTYAATNTDVIVSDALAAVAQRRYDIVLTNPPFHAGHAIDYDIARTMIAHARELLLPGGKLVFVANRFLRYDREPGLGYRRFVRVAETKQFHVLMAEV